MPRPSRPLPVPHHVVPPLLRYLRERGLDADALIARFELPADVERRPVADMPVVAFGELLADAAAMAGEPFLALELPGRLEFTRYNYAELTSAASPTYRDALTRLVRYAPLVNRSLVFAYAEAGEELLWTQRTRGHPRGIGRHAHEYGLAVALYHARCQLDSALRARRVWFMHGRPSEVAPLVAYFGTDDIEFERSENGMALDRALLDRPLPTADSRMLATADALAESALAETPRDFLGAVRGAIRASLGDGSTPTAGSIARTLRMSARTLQRRIGAEATTFSALCDAVRADEARAMMRAGELPIGEVAWRLGFADAASFGRAFRRWTGTTPAAYRDAHT
ncbi:MAG: AraC family transcriptional regulator ligand-binding domain-containing protein [Sandaracinaceae bacterium]